MLGLTFFPPLRLAVHREQCLWKFSGHGVKQPVPVRFVFRSACAGAPPAFDAEFVFDFDRPEGKHTGESAGVFGIGIDHRGEPNLHRAFAGIEVAEGRVGNVSGLRGAAAEAEEERAEQTPRKVADGWNREGRGLFCLTVSQFHLILVLPKRWKYCQSKNIAFQQSDCFCSRFTPCRYNVMLPPHVILITEKLNPCTQ